MHDETSEHAGKLIPSFICRVATENVTGETTEASNTTEPEFEWEEVYNSTEPNATASVFGADPTESGRTEPTEPTEPTETTEPTESSAIETAQTQQTTEPQTEMTSHESGLVKDTLSSAKQQQPHPGMFVLFFVGLVMAVTLVMTLLHFAKSRRDRNYQRQNQDIEVRSISSMGSELW